MEGRRKVPPAPGMIARRVSGRPTTAVLAKMRKWVVRASSRPPPRAREDIAVMVGIGRVVIVVNVKRSFARNSVVLEEDEGGRGNALGFGFSVWAGRRGLDGGEPARGRQRRTDSLGRREHCPFFQVGARAEAGINFAGEDERPYRS